VILRVGGADLEEGSDSSGYAPVALDRYSVYCDGKTGGTTSCDPVLSSLLGDNVTVGSHNFKLLSLGYGGGGLGHMSALDQDVSILAVTGSSADPLEPLYDFGGRRRRRGRVLQPAHPLEGASEAGIELQQQRRQPKLLHQQTRKLAGSGGSYVTNAALGGSPHGGSFVSGSVGTRNSSVATWGASVPLLWTLPSSVTATGCFLCVALWGALLDAVHKVGLWVDGLMVDGSMG